MSEGLNRVMLLGNVGAAPELRMTHGGTHVLSFRLATTESYLDKDKVRRERTEWHSITVWGRRAEGLSKILNKGDRVFVEGSLRTTEYEPREGGKRQKTEIHATTVLLCGGRGGKPPEGDEGGATAGYQRGRQPGRQPETGYDREEFQEPY